MTKTVHKDTKAELIEAAERLLATRGIGTVTAMEIIKDANARNASAVRYHFGNLENLIQAVFEKRVSEIDQDRLQHISQLDERGDGNDLKMLLGVIARAPLESCETEGGQFYAQFLAQLSADPRFDVEELLGDFLPESMRLVRGRIIQILADHPRDHLIDRVRRLNTIAISLVADYARRKAGGTAPTINVAAGEIANCLAAFLTAPYD